MKGLLDEGARRIGVVGLPPIGCLPIVITLYSNNAFYKRECIDRLSSIARDYNQKLQTQLSTMKLKSANSGKRIGYMDVYGPLEDMAFHRKYGTWINFDQINFMWNGLTWYQSKQISDNLIDFFFFLFC